MAKVPTASNTAGLNTFKAFAADGPDGFEEEGKPLKDCIVIGGGPAGLTAAIYLARYHLSVIVFDDNCSRAASIPVSHNHAGFPEGITGPDLLDRMRTQAANHDVEFCNRRVTALTRVADAFIVSSEGADDARARFVLLATGVTNNRPPMPSASHDEAVARGLIRYCPVCDGFEITDKPVGVFGRGSKAFQEVLFLRSYTQDVTLISPDADHGLEEKQLSQHRGRRWTSKDL